MNGRPSTFSTRKARADVTGKPSGPRGGAVPISAQRGPLRTLSFFRSFDWSSANRRAPRELAPVGGVPGPGLAGRWETRRRCSRRANKPKGSLAGGRRAGAGPWSAGCGAGEHAVPAGSSLPRSGRRGRPLSG